VFERFSEQARRVLFFARVEVSRWGSPQIDPEHLLLGLIREGKGTAYDLLFEDLHFDWRRVVRDIESQMEKKSGFAQSLEIPFSRSTKEVLAATVEEAERLQDNEIGTQHLLLGILLIDSIAASVLTAHGVTLELARQKL
jgi:ATP-dependent Clp protease ATP-binding subunit ClpC